MRLRTVAVVCLLLGSANVLAESESTDYLHVNWLNKSVSPSQNFYAYANGGWQKTHPIPRAYPSWNLFSITDERNQLRLRTLIEAAAQNSQSGSIAQKVGDFYASGMDEASINKLGASPLQPEFQRIAQMQTYADLQAEIAHLQTLGVDAVFGFGEMQDFKNSDQVIGVTSQGGLGLPDRDYYVKNTARFASIRAAYRQHMVRMFELLGDTPQASVKEAKTVMTIETALAKASMTRVEQRDPQAVYHIKTLAELHSLTPHFSWQAYFAAMQHPEITQINVATPHFFQVMNEELVSVPLMDWKTYLRWHLIEAYAGALSKPFVDENFNMVKRMTGAKVLLPRWKRVVNAEDAGLGFAIGKLYVEHYFPPASKEKVEVLVSHIRAALREDLQHVTWMSPATRAAALKKLASMEDRIGYPSTWWDYSALQIDKGAYAVNMMHVSQFIMRRELNKIGKPVDKEEWEMAPQTVNAYYDPSLNRLNIPAGILQPPFFDPHAPDAVNYGAIGFVIGHEMTHGFDDEGAQFDEKGNLNNWWTPEDLKKFNTRTQHLAQQFSGYTVQGEHLQGKLVVGEAAADLGGLTLAYRAGHADGFHHAKSVEGFTPDQQFFLSAAHVWAMNMRPEEMRKKVITDPHPPALYRVNGTFADMPAFQQAFHIAAQSPMVNKDKVTIW